MVAIGSAWKSCDLISTADCYCRFIVYASPAAIEDAQWSSCEKKYDCWHHL